MKTLEQHFYDWRSRFFGYGYGTGEQHTIGALKDFLEAFGVKPSGGATYDYKVLEAKVGARVAWLLINKLCGSDMNFLEYGTSPRFGWVGQDGYQATLFHYITAHTLGELLDFSPSDSNEYCECYPTHCNCDDKGCEQSPNPFWKVVKK